MSKKFFKKAISLTSIAALLPTLLAGCSATKEVVATTKAPGVEAKTTAASVKKEPYKLTIMAPGASDDDMAKEYAKKTCDKIREYTNTNVEFISYPDTMYYEKVPLLLATGDLPSIMVMGKDAAFESAVANNIFWEVGPYIKDYKNLSTINEVALTNVSSNGKVFALPRSRAVGRNGAGYRLDWVENLGLTEPKTLDDLYKMLVAFTKNDPDGNGKNDTFGMAVTNYGGPWDNLQVWFGAPNGWGLDAKGELIPAHMTKEYDEALKWFRKIYSEGLVNKDFATYDSAKWDDMLRGETNVAGFAVDVTDRFTKIHEFFEKGNMPGKEQIVGGFENSKGEKKFLPTAGFNGILVFSKSKIKSEEDLKSSLSFIDKLSDAEMLNLIIGFEDVHWKMNKEKGYIERIDIKDKPELNNLKNLNQMTTYYVSKEEVAKQLVEAPLNAIRTLSAQVQTDNEKYVIKNPAAAYTSPTYVSVGTEITKIMNDARTKYIMGEIDDVGLQAAKDQWLKAGGQNVIKEYNDLYKANKK
jgi:putative aldouronate transport system substrate-binding protein